MDSIDVIIIGAGPGGYVAAIRAAQLGLKACVIEKDKPGGVCLNVGCIPTKNLIKQAETFSSISELKEMGINIDTGNFDYSKVVEKAKKTSEMLSRGVQFLLKKNNVELIQGKAKILEKGKISIDGERIIEGKNIIIASGSRPKCIPGFEFDGDLVISSTEALFPEKLPKRIIILGAGAVGCEFAFIMNSFGVDVTLIEMMDQILPLEDTETATVIERAFKKKKINVITGAKAKKLDKKDGKVIITLEKNNQETCIEADKILVAIGRTPNTEDIGLENVGITTEKGFIPVKDYYMTEKENIFAIGDVVATPLLAHVASKEGEIAVEYIAGHKTERMIDRNSIPSAVYTDPELASFGMTEKDVQTKGINFKKAVFTYRGIGKAMAIGKPDGIAKILYNPDSKEIIGAHIVGQNATELIHEILLAKNNKLLPENVYSTIHAHPTLSELVMEVMRAVDGIAIHN